MSEKCEWKDGKFKGCDECNPAIKKTYNIGKEIYDVECLSCGHSISKPEPEKPKINSRDIRPGIYTVFWKSGGTSIAAIGMTESGSRWIAPINWSQPSADQTIFNNIDKLELICIQDGKN